MDKLVYDASTAPLGGPVDLIRRLIAQSLMRPLRVVKPEILRQTQQELRQRAMALEIDFFILDASPQPLHKNVIQCPPPPVHANGNVLRLEPVGERGAGKLAALGRC